MGGVVEGSNLAYCALRRNGRRDVGGAIYREKSSGGPRQDENQHWIRNEPRSTTIADSQADGRFF